MTFDYSMYDDAARHTVTTAMNEARCRNHARYNLEHILLGLTKTGSAVSPLLNHYGVTYEAVTQRMEVRNPRRSTSIDSTQPGPYVVDLLDDVQRRVKTSSKQHANCLHLLYSTLRLLMEDDCIAAKICSDLHVNEAALYHEVIILIKADLVSDAIAQNNVSIEALTAAFVRVVDDSQFNQVLTLINK